MTEIARRRLPLTIESPYSRKVLLGIAEGERKAVAHLLIEDRTAGAALAIAEAASNRTLGLAAAALENHPPPRPIACSAGCFVCCSSKVLLLAPEALRIAEYLRRTRSAGELAEVLRRVEVADEQTRGLDCSARAEANIPCPLLENGCCSVYEVRPMVCAGWTSLDVGECHRYWESPNGRVSPPVFALQYELSGAVTAGAAMGIRDAGLDGHLLELNAAIRIALSRPNAGERWRRGLPVFAQARDSERPRAADDDATDDSPG